MTTTRRRPRRSRLTLLLLLAAAAPVAAVAAAPDADWNRFRGPNGSGVAPAAHTPARFTEADFNWRIDLPGVGHLLHWQDTPNTLRLLHAFLASL